MSGRKLKIVLVSPKGPLYRHRGGIWKKSLRYQPLTLTTLAALIPPEIPVDLQLFDEGIADVPLDLDADLVGLTVITGTAMRAYELADHFRGRGIESRAWWPACDAHPRRCTTARRCDCRRLRRRFMAAITARLRAWRS
jgi:hypothetical protein